MKLPERRVTTPVDDPYQYDADWRAAVSEYLFSVGARKDGDLKSICETGCLEVEMSDVGSEDGAKKRRKGAKNGRAKGKKTGDMQKKTLVPVEPFFEHAKYRRLAADRWIAGHIGMCEGRASEKPLEDRHAAFLLAERWHEEDDSMESSMKKRLEPLLLTEVGLDVVSLDLLGTAEAIPAIEAYEKMYFNCRDDKFALSGSMQLVSRIAMPYGPLKMYLKKWEELKDGFCVQDGRPLARESDIWKAIGATMGYDVLMCAWHWDWRAHGMKDRSLRHKIECSWNIAVSKTMSEMFTGDIRHEDAARFLASCTSQLKLISDEKEKAGSGGSDGATKALMNILYLAAPKMAQFDEAESSARNEEIQNRIKSQLAINKQAVEDRGEQVEAEVVDGQIASAVER